MRLFSGLVLLCTTLWLGGAAQADQSPVFTDYRLPEAAVDFELKNHLATVAQTEHYSDDPLVLYFKALKTEDLPGASLYLQHAALEGIVPAMLLLANKKLASDSWHHKNGATDLLRRAAASGSGMACTLLGKMYIDGHIVERDLHLGLNLLHRATDNGGADAYYNLGVAYADRLGDLGIAEKYLQQAARMNLKQAAEKLSEIKKRNI